MSLRLASCRRAISSALALTNTNSEPLGEGRKCALAEVGSRVQFLLTKSQHHESML